MKLGERITHARKKVKMTQRELGDILGVNLNSVSRWENGSQQPTADALFRLAKALNISISYLMGETDEMASAVPRQELPIHHTGDLPPAGTNEFDASLGPLFYEHLKKHGMKASFTEMRMTRECLLASLELVEGFLIQERERETQKLASA